MCCFVTVLRVVRLRLGFDLDTLTVNESPNEKHIIFGFSGGYPVVNRLRRSDRRERFARSTVEVALSLSN